MRTHPTPPGQVGLVTGSGRGIGADVARELASVAMRVAVTGRTRESVDAVAGQIGGLALVGDVSRRDNVEGWVAETEHRLGPIDLLVNNAAVAGAPEPFWQHDPDEWWHVFEVNVLGPYLCCHAVLPGMVERRRGRIVNVTSGAAFVRTLPPNARDTSYPPSKAALTRFTEVLAAQVAEYGVFVFAGVGGEPRSVLKHRSIVKTAASRLCWSHVDRDRSRGPPASSDGSTSSRHSIRSAAPESVRRPTR